LTSSVSASPTFERRLCLVKAGMNSISSQVHSFWCL
jgi:hypothetical protein